jgi:DNA-binding transcriptional regulator YdaS (Cro superfamily)
MKIENYIAKQGITISDFAKRLGVSRNLVYQWVNNIRPVAARHCPRIEALTDGQVTRPELRPDDWRALWPDLPAQRISKPRKASPATG